MGDKTFEPENGCPLKSIDVGETIQLIIIDTQWYLENWNDSPTINDKCDIKTRKCFFDELEAELKKAQGKTIVFAMHHPLYTNGIHGGTYGISKYLFPFQKKYHYLFWRRLLHKYELREMSLLKTVIMSGTII